MTGVKLKIREGKTSDHEIVLKIATSLDDWFSESGIKYIKQDLDYQGLLIAELNSAPIGFLSFFTYEGVGYLGCVGVYQHYCGLRKSVFINTATHSASKFYELRGYKNHATYYRKKL